MMVISSENHWNDTILNAMILWRYLNTFLAFFDFFRFSTPPTTPNKFTNFPKYDINIYNIYMSVSRLPPPPWRQNLRFCTFFDYRSSQFSSYAASSTPKDTKFVSLGVLDILNTFLVFLYFFDIFASHIAHFQKNISARKMTQI